MKTAAYILLVLLVLGAAVVWEVASWEECLETQSWWYCLRLLGK